jgi:DNA-binding GntR family transcriptional regulator
VTRQPTRTEVVYDQLRDDIVSGTLPPGSKLRFAELGERYGASMGVTREALSRLAEQGFVTSEPQLGFRVVSLSAANLAIDHGTVQWEANLLAAHHALTRTDASDGVHPGLAPAWTSAHERFHEALIAGGPNVRLKSLATSLRANAEIYRSWSTNYGTSRSIADEHRALCEATLDRDRNTALSLLIAHLVETARVLLDAAPDADESCLTRLSHIPTVCSTGAQLFAVRTKPGDRSGR